MSVTTQAIVAKVNAAFDEGSTDCPNIMSKPAIVVRAARSIGGPRE